MWSRKLADVATAVDGVSDRLAGMSGKPIEAAVSRLSVLAARAARLACVLGEAEAGLSTYGVALAEHQGAAATAIRDDEVAHAEYGRVESQFNSLREQAEYALSRGDVGTANACADEGRLRRGTMGAFDLDESDAVRRWDQAREGARAAASTAASALGVVAQGPSAVNLVVAPAPEWSPMAAAAGQSAAEHLGRIGSGELSAEDLAAELALVEELRAKYGADPGFYAGLLATREDTEGFYAFLRVAAAAGSGPVADAGRAFATGARDTLGVWTAQLPEVEQVRVGRDLVAATGEDLGGQAGVFAAFLLSGGVPAGVASGAAEELDARLRPMGPVSVIDSGGGIAEAFLGIADRPWAERDLSYAVFAALAAHPGAALEFWAPTDREAGEGRAAFWLDADKYPDDMANLMADGGTVVYSSIASAVDFGSTSGDLAVSDRAALLMVDVTTAITEPYGHFYAAGDLSDEAMVLLARSYLPYVDGIGIAIEDSGDWRTTDDGLLAGYRDMGFDDDGDPVPRASMGVFPRDRIIDVLTEMHATPVGRDAWSGVLLDHLGATGANSSPLNLGERRTVLEFAARNAAQIWGVVDAADVTAAADRDTAVAGMVTDAATILAALTGPGSRPGAAALGVGVNQALGILVPSFALEDDVLAGIRADYDSRITGLVGAYQAGLEGATGVHHDDVNEFLATEAGYEEGHSDSPLETVKRAIENQMKATRDDETH